MDQMCHPLTSLFDRIPELQSKHCCKFSPELEKAKISYLAFKRARIISKEREALNLLRFICHWSSGWYRAYV